ncbi:TetR/AcrR family transcriptional regulator [Erysipelotrichaceae bacterium OttesenSCG-928-M19]|nr:TetR/AcrR family transcriptional regulator [Erysipelotrichaceae bacterium OttesenSCG-928-M19]
MNGFEKRTLEKKEQILKVTFSLMNQDDGITNLTMTEVAQLANVAKATIFKYFGSKENLIHEVYRSFIDNMRSDLLKIKEKNLVFEDLLMAMSKVKIHYLDMINKQFYLDLMAYYTKKESDELDSLLQEYLQESMNIMLDIFHQGRKERKIDLKYSDEFLLVYFEAMLEGLSKKSIYERAKPYTEQWTELLIKGIAPSK